MIKADNLIQDTRKEEPMHFREVLDRLKKSAVKPGVDLAGIVQKLRERREKKKHG
jgi:hypothetical protein